MTTGRSSERPVYVSGKGKVIVAHNHILSMLVLFLLLLGVVLICVGLICMFILFATALIFPKKREKLVPIDNALDAVFKFAALLEVIGLALTIMLSYR